MLCLYYTKCNGRFICTPVIANVYMYTIVLDAKAFHALKKI